MATTTKKAAPTTGYGYVNAFPGMLAAFSQWDWFEDNPDVLWPASVRTFTKMPREDGRLASLLRAIGLPIRQTRWSIDPNGARPEVVKLVAGDLGLPIRGDNEDASPSPRTKFSWSQHLRWALKFQQFGHAVFERIYEIEDGRAHLVQLAPRPSSTIAFWDVGLDGGLDGLQQWPAGTLGWSGGVFPASLGGAKMIPGNRLLTYVHEQDPGVWVGNSIIRPAYGNWRFKNELQRIEVAAARRHGIGTPVINVSEEESEDTDRLDLYGQIAQQWRSGDNAGVAFPFGTDGKIIGVTGTLPGDLIRQGIEWHDKQMGIVCLAHFLNLDSGGSYALASVLTDPFIEAENAEAEMIKDFAQAGIIEELVTVNWGPDEPCPLLTFEEIGARQDATAAALQLLVTAGLITPDKKLEAYQRLILGLPPADPATAEPDPDDGGDPAHVPSEPPAVKTQPGNRVPVRAHSRRNRPARAAKAAATAGSQLEMEF